MSRHFVLKTVPRCMIADMLNGNGLYGAVVYFYRFPYTFI